MTKKTKTLTGFTELTSSELHRISGGDWWRDLSRIFPQKGRLTDSNNRHKIG
ncbi:ComC/BlpC family leader-containing pheromone/bacteriocin [Streptococcus agalactiae]|uniref:ComC/BlpC family leader-containing pheromone/bacteriocin n=1 Tax=Streptococcus agalactiae TaxID=1311 RepID=UPI003C7070C5